MYTQRSTDKTNSLKVEARKAEGESFFAVAASPHAQIVAQFFAFS